MADKYLLDTHALIWYLEGNRRLGTQAQQIMDDFNNELILPIIALAEAIHIVDRNRTSIPSTSDLMQGVADAPHLEIATLTWPILQQSLRATAVPEMHDRLIVATALHLQAQGHEVWLVTRDEEMSVAGLVDILW
jgi:PIN domain nuclease of toxin-antitoxin system